MHLPKAFVILIFIVLHGVQTSPVRAQTFKEMIVESRPTGEGYSLCGSCSLPKEISSSVWLIPKDEPGEPVVLSGTVYEEDGVTPDSGVTLFLYQTDAGGFYHRPKEDVFHPRLFGWIRTGADGKYEIHTVRPFPEILAPGEPGHIHVHVFGKGMKEHFLHEFWFQGDSRITKSDRDRFARLGDFSPIVKLSKDKDGALKGTRNMRIRPAPQWKYEKD